MERRPRTQPENYNTEREGKGKIQKLAKYLFRGTKQGTQLFMAAAPHVRGEVRIRFATTICGGITPAWAGRRNGVVAAIWRIRDHPRVRGEKSLLAFSTAFEAGSPPRARGEGSSSVHTCRPPGITPACAGRSIYDPIRICTRWDHPRVRGEKPFRFFSSWRNVGSPPRARGEECALHRQSQ